MPKCVGSRWIYTGYGHRSLGGAKMEEYEIVRPCEIIAVSYSANFPTVPRYSIRCDHGFIRYGYDANLSPLA